MKKLVILSFIMALFLGLSAQKQKMQSDLTEKDCVFCTKDGEKYTGVAYTYHKNGKREKEIEYKKGLAIKETTFYENGDPKSISTLKKGKLNGEFVAYYEGKKIKTEGKYKKGKKAGTWKNYDEKGNIKN